MPRNVGRLDLDRGEDEHTVTIGQWRRLRSTPPPRMTTPPPRMRTADRATPPGSGRTCGRIATYNAGCRCAACREAARVARARIRARAS